MHAESHKDEGPVRVNPKEGRYSNLFRVGHNSFEFVLDCGQLFPDEKGEYFHTRVITSPRHAKELLFVLTQAIDQYEQSFGSIATENYE